MYVYIVILSLEFMNLVTNRVSLMSLRPLR